MNSKEAMGLILVLVFTIAVFAYVERPVLVTPEITSSCPSNQFATSEDSSGNFLCNFLSSVHAEFTGQTSGITVVTFATPSGNPSTYDIPCYTVATAIIGTVVCQVSYTEAVTGTSRTLTLFTESSLTPSQGQGHIWVAPSTTITVATLITLTVTYNVEASIVRLS